MGVKQHDMSGAYDRRDRQREFRHWRKKFQERRDRQALSDSTIEVLKPLAGFLLRKKGE
jgi:hypothetical protein